MFAFAIWDAEHRSLFLARDRFGVKPLLYYWQEGLFLFASEMKAIKALRRADEVDAEYSCHPAVFLSHVQDFAGYGVQRGPPAGSGHFLVLKDEENSASIVGTILPHATRKKSIPRSKGNRRSGKLWKELYGTGSCPTSPWALF